jgi:ribonuclease R
MRLTPERVLAALRSRREAVTPARLALALFGDTGEIREVRAMLRALEERGHAFRVEGRYRARREDGAVEGQVASRAADGGVHVADPSGGSWHLADAEGTRVGDRVLVRPVEEASHRRAELLQVLEGSRERWIGILHRRRGMLYATPYRDDTDWWLRVPAGEAGDARDGEVVELVPVERRRRRRLEEAPWARVARRIGRPGEPDADFAAVVWRHRLPVEFPAEVEREAHAIAQARVRESPDDRLDLRAHPFVTIDPEDARDFDDALCAEIDSGGQLRLWVAVADVSHYVPAGSAVDREALRRGNSVYFPDRAIPMLPPLLSADLCSLRPGQERLALVVELCCDARGATRSARVHAARIRSQARLSYGEAQAQLEGGAGPHAGMLRRVARWAGLAARERRQRGGLDFELPGVEIGFDAAGWPDRVTRAVRTDAHRLVEEAMLAANRAVAEWLSGDGLAVPFRNHEAPGPEDAALLAEQLRALGIARELPRGPLGSRALARALMRVPADRVAIVHAIALRHMRQARYGAASLGHYALAMPHYLHFTSPIRRYADLAVHRAVKRRLSASALPSGFAEAERVAARASFRERLAQRAEREVVDLARCAFLARRTGEEHLGTVSGLGRAGLFVTLDPWPIDGLVPASRLDVREVDALGHVLTTRGGRRFRLGQEVRVRIAAVDVVRARIDFELVESGADATEAGARRARAQSRGARRGGSERRAGGRTRRSAAARL